MAQENDPIIEFDIPQDEEQPSESGMSMRQMIAMVPRVVGGLAGGVVSTVPSPATTGGGFVLGAVGDAIAQMIEKNTLNPLEVDKSHALAEGGLAAIPGGKLFQAGKFLKSALGGAAFTGLGMGVRRYEQGQPILSENSMDDVKELALGGAIGGTMSKYAEPVVRGLKNVFGRSAGVPPSINPNSVQADPIPGYSPPTATHLPTDIDGVPVNFNRVEDGKIILRAPENTAFGVKGRPVAKPGIKEPEISLEQRAELQADMDKAVEPVATAAFKKSTADQLADMNRGQADVRMTTGSLTPEANTDPIAAHHIAGKDHLRAIITNPTEASADDIRLYDTRVGGTGALPDNELSQATQNALNRPANPKMAEGQRNASRRAEAAGLKAEERADYSQMNKDAKAAEAAKKLAAAKLKADQKAAAEAVKKAEKAKEEADALIEFNRLKEGRLADTPTVRETVSAKTGPGERGTASTVYITEEEAAARLAEGGGSKGGRKNISVTRGAEANRAKGEEYIKAADEFEKTLPPPGPARDIYDAWIAKGVKHEIALKNAALAIRPQGMKPSLGRTPPAKPPAPIAPETTPVGSEPFNPPRIIDPKGPSITIAGLGDAPIAPEVPRTGPLPGDTPNPLIDPVVTRPESDMADLRSRISKRIDLSETPPPGTPNSGEGIPAAWKEALRRTGLSATEITYTDNAIKASPNLSKELLEEVRTYMKSKGVLPDEPQMVRRPPSFGATPAAPSPATGGKIPDKVREGLVRRGDTPEAIAALEAGELTEDMQKLISLSDDYNKLVELRTSNPDKWTPELEAQRAAAGKALATQSRAMGIPPAPRAVGVKPPKEAKPMGRPPKNAVPVQRGWFGRTANERIEHELEVLGELAKGNEQFPPATLAELTDNVEEMLRFFPKEEQEAARDTMMLAVNKLAGNQDFTVGSIHKQPTLGKTAVTDEIIKDPKQKGEITNDAMFRFGLALAGGTGGLVLDPLDNPAASTAAGLAIGAGAPSLFRGSAKDQIGKILKRLPNAQRFNLLSKGDSLVANSAAGPWGTGIMSGIEHALALDERGIAALKGFLNPINVMRKIPGAWDEAGERIRRGEMGRGEADLTPYGSEETRFDQWLSGPGRIMTTGDVIANEILQEAGYDLTEARRITHTGEPEWNLSKKIVNFGRGNPGDNTIAQVLLPFRKTLANIVEQGAQRTPVLGFMVQATREHPDPWARVLVQQGMGGVVFVGASMLGETMETPEDIILYRKFLSNLSGQYALLANAGFAVGVARNKGRIEDLGDVAGTALTSAAGDLPLPSTRPITDVGKFLAKDDKQYPQDLPNMFVPGFLRGTDGESMSDMISSFMSRNQQPILQLFDDDGNPIQ